MYHRMKEKEKRDKLFVALIIAIVSCLMPVAYTQTYGVITRLTEPVVARVGGSAVLNCTVTSPPGATHYVEWFFLNYTGGGKVITSSCRVMEEHNIITGQEKYVISCFQEANGDELFSLRINLLTIPDNGVYQCRVRQSGSPMPLSSMNVMLTVLSPPKMITSASDIRKDSFIGANVSMDCYAEGVPAPNVTWGRANGRPLPLDGRSRQFKMYQTTTQTIQRLEIANLTKEDRGTYRCSADNNIRPPDDFYSRLDVEFPPSVAAVEPSYGAASGENQQAMMWCKVDGNPRPTMYWYALSKENSKEFEDGTLEITSAFLSTATEIRSDNKYKVEQKIMTVGSLSTMESMFYSLTLQMVEAGDMTYYICRAQNTHGDGWSAVQLYRINTLSDDGRFSSAGIHTVGYPVILILLFLSIIL